MPTAMVTFNGRITLPAEVRKELGLKIGDSVDFVEDGKGCFSIHHRPASDDQADAQSDDEVDRSTAMRRLESSLM
jgi:AbrB family looped-hinge helix DNA binding protein